MADGESGGVGEGVMSEATLSDEMRLAEELRSKRAEILDVAARHGAGNLAVFGSVARGEETAESDVDLLIDVAGPTSAWFPGGLVA